MFTKQCVVTLDLEGVLAPEIWIAVAEKTGIKDLRLTTRDIPDYDVLMKGRIKILERENIKLSDIQNVIANLGLLDGARDFMDTLRDEAQVIILSDTFQEFAYPIMKNLGFPTIFCHNLVVENDMIKGYHLRMSERACSSRPTRAVSSALRIPSWHSSRSSKPQRPTQNFWTNSTSSRIRCKKSTKYTKTVDTMSAVIFYNQSMVNSH